MGKSRGEIFRAIAQKRPSSNNFDLSHDHKLSLKMGWLVPVLTQECLPGDKWRISSSCLLRMAPLLAPVMHKAKVKLEAFFCPNRLCWDDWAEFITGGDGFTTPPAFPYLPLAGPAQFSGLQDYLGIPTLVGSSGFAEQISAIPFSGYQLIFNEYYRDENLVDLIDYKLANGDNVANATALTALRQRAWMHDYFTSALPFAQKGDPISLPIAGFSDVGLNWNTGGGTAEPRWRAVDSLAFDADGVINVSNTGGNAFGNVTADQIGPNRNVLFDPDGTLTADTSSLSAQAITINDLRRAEALQIWLEANARGGSRYTESIKMHFDVNSPDARLQRPEYIGGISNPVVFSEVLQTSATDPSDPTVTPQGNMAGHGISAGSGGAMSYFCQEHGFIHIIMSVLPDTAYTQGLARFWFKNDKFLYGWPELANLGEQSILNKELYLADDGLNDDVFGYTPRYSEYKYQSDRISGQFADTLDFWHFARIFAARPVLDEAFIQANPTTRVFAVTDDTIDHVYSHVMFNINTRRMLPRFGIPTIT